MDIQPAEDALKVTCLITESVADPILVYDDAAPLAMAVVDRPFCHLLPQAWDVPGVYLLLDPIEADGSWGCYVGQAAQPGLRTRMQQHLKLKDHWSRALLITSDRTIGWNSAQIGWLEGRLYDFVHIMEAAKLSNGNRPSDETVPAYERTPLETCMGATSRVLRLLGYDTSAPGDEPPQVERRRRSSYDVSLEDIVNSGLLTAGTQLVSLMPTWPAIAVVNPDGTMSVNGQSYDKPSPAANAVGARVNGWIFWGTEDETGRSPIAVLRQRVRDLAVESAQ